MVREVGGYGRWGVVREASPGKQGAVHFPGELHHLPFKPFALTSPLHASRGECTLPVCCCQPCVWMRWHWKGAHRCRWWTAFSDIMRPLSARAQLHGM